MLYSIFISGFLSLFKTAMAAIDLVHLTLDSDDMTLFLIYI